MLTMIISVIFFLIFIALGQMLMILNATAYVLTIMYLIDLWFVKLLYQNKFLK